MGSAREDNFGARESCQSQLTTGGRYMKTMLKQLLLVSAMMLATVAALADGDPYADAIIVFKQAGQSDSFFSRSYAYAVFPTIAKGGLWVGAAHGRGRVYRQGHHIADTSMTQVSRCASGWTSV